MAQHWPPSPSVEDEEAALAREHALVQPRLTKNDELPAGTRGTVDQYPIILDVDRQATAAHDDTASDPERPCGSHSSDESLGPPTPTHAKGEQRFVYIPQPEAATAAPVRPTEGLRGRPQVARIQTDLGADLQDMITGQRRAPSPYSYTAAAKGENAEAGHRWPGGRRGPADDGPGLRTDPPRAASARPRGQTEDLDSSTDADRRPARRRQASRKRSTRESGARPPSPTQHAPEARPASGRRPQGRHMEARKGRAPGESPDTSPAEDARASRTRQPGGPTPPRAPRDSPYTSSAEEATAQRSTLDAAAARARRGSMRRRERPPLDLQSHHYSYGAGEIPEEKPASRTHRPESKHHAVYDGRSYLEPAALRSPKGTEDYLENAFRDNMARGTARSPRPSPAASPLTSPPATPPRTPQPDRRPKEYGAGGASGPAHPPGHARPRPASRDDGFVNELKPWAAAIATAAMAKLATDGPPSLSRSSTASAEKTGPGPASRTSSGRRSRNSSPARDDARPMARANSCAPPDLRPIVTRAPTFPVTDGRPSSRTGSYAPAPDHSPRHPHRTFSYSSAEERPHQRPAQKPRLSQTTFLPVTVTESKAATTGARPVRSSPSPSEKLPPSPAVGVPPPSLPPCPRSKPVAGCHDWYTIKDMPELDICPTCMSRIGTSRFRDAFVPSLAKPGTQEIQCALSTPWIRNAWIQIMKQHRRSLDLIYQLIHLPPTTKPCPGKKGEVRSWYRIVDPETGVPVPNFEACSACVRGVEYMFPPLKGVFTRATGMVERTCDLTCESKRFAGYMAQLDRAAVRCEVERLREPDVQALADHARRTARVRECTRDDKIRSQPWHFMPQLPEFTICEECFQDVVWPVINQPIAANINRTLQMLPGEGPHTNGVSCQLYSDRMRKVFGEAVQYNDFDLLKAVATRRHGVEKLLQEKHRLLVRDMAMGMDRTVELQETIRTWMQWE